MRVSTSMCVSRSNTTSPVSSSTIGVAEMPAEEVLVGLVRPHGHVGRGGLALLHLDLGVRQRGVDLAEEADLGRADLLALLEHDTVAARPLDVLGEGRALEQRVLLTPAGPRRHRHPFLGAAVFLADGDVLAHVHQTAGEVPGVGGAQGGVGETLAGAVGGDEELEHGEAFDEARLHRLLDDLALRIGHLAAPAGELTDLLDVAAGAGGGHHVDRVERVEVRPGGRRDLDVGFTPDLLHLAAALLLGEEAVVVLVLELVDHGLVRARGSRPSPWRGRPRRSWRR